MTISTEHLPDDVERIPAVVKGMVPSYRTECDHCVFLKGVVRPEAIYFY